MPSLRPKIITIMKRTFFILVLVSLTTLTFCKKIDDKSIEDIADKEPEVVYADFATVLSKAMYCEPSLRSFIKQEALRKFDCDYDVFCPWVFDTNIDGRTFIQILEKYDSCDCLNSVLKVLPKLTILVPDWSWVNENCFSIHNWDTNNKEVTIGYQSNNGTCEVYYNGCHFETIEPGVFTSAPLLILKQNERMVATHDTKSQEVNYSFLFESFNNTENAETKVGGTYHYPINFQYEEVNDSLDNSTLHGRVGQAYNICHSTQGLPQRDYIYYSLLSPTDSGHVDFNCHEVIKKIKFTNIGGWAQDRNVPDPDYVLKDYWLQGNNNLYDNNTLKNLLWAEGDIEVVFNIFNGGEQPIRFARSLSINDAFNVIHVENVRKYNWVGALQNSHYYVDWTCFSPKWVDVNWMLPVWDLSRYPREFRIQAYETDGNSEYTETITEEYSYSSNFKWNVGIEGSFPLDSIKAGVKVGAEGTTTDSEKIQKTTTCSYHYSDDFLGETIVDYRDNVILSQGATKSLVRVYHLGNVDVMFLPVMDL